MTRSQQGGQWSGASVQLWTPAEHRPLATGHYLRGFTLVEILIVVSIIGILAMMVVPHIANSANVARENALRDDLRYLRSQIGLYKAQHHDVAPGLNGTFVDQMTLPTDQAGHTNPTPTAVFKYGPYLAQVPTNPLSTPDVADQVLISNAADLATAVNDSTGWIYNPNTQQIIANLSGKDANGSGIPYASY